MAAIDPDVHCPHLNVISEACNEQTCVVAGDAQFVDLSIDDKLMNVIKTLNNTVLNRPEWEFPKICPIN